MELTLVLTHACNLGLARLGAPLSRIEEIPRSGRRRLAEELAPMIAEYRTLWLLRNRPGGLDDSAARLDRLLGLYCAT